GRRVERKKAARTESKRFRQAINIMLTANEVLGNGFLSPAHCFPLFVLTPATATSMIRPVNISVTNRLPVLGSSAMLVGVIRQSAITTGGPPGEVNSCNLPGACANWSVLNSSVKNSFPPPGVFTGSTSMADVKPVMNG